VTLSALILAGGRATRFGGVAKHELVIEGRTIFARQVAVLASLVDEIIVSGADVPGYRTVADAVAGAGPLAGIAAGLAAARTEWLLVIAGDMPHIHAPVVELIASKIDPMIDAVGIRIGELPEPLLCALRCSIRDVVERRIAAGQRKASRLLTDGELRVCWIEEPELRAIDPEARALFNVNAPTDMPAE
jgi:molybdopterin-guanine dinucleotide biosynthesis protein A